MQRQESPPLFDLSEIPVRPTDLRFRPANGPVWTNNKARLIQRYIRYFTYITKHGTYIDCFAGPQQRHHPESWAAKLVMDLEPARIRHIFLFEKLTWKIRRLNEMISAAKVVPKREAKVFHGDMNAKLADFLNSRQIKDTEATFCLLDQHTFECDWSTVELIARHKAGGNKIEQFYFLAQSWIDRAQAGIKIKKEERLSKWWGDSSWKTLIKKPSEDRGLYMADRFKKELGYAYAYPFPIYEKPASEGFGKVMFYMIHASDHPEAPKQMLRAYNNAVSPLEPIEQMELEFGG